MKFLSRLLGSRKAGSRSQSGSAAAQVIARALDAGGVRSGEGQGIDIRATIDRALADAGLQPPGPATARGGVPQPGPAPEDARGEFLQATFSNAHGRRDYRLYLPAGYGQRSDALPLVLMLHGCTQSPEDFARGTRMNALADRHGLLVAYPEQDGEQNRARCWNWFRPEDQQAGSGEPAILAGIVQAIAADHRVDTSRVFAAGLSAGAAMAVVLGRTEPGLFRAIGVHSGVPYGRAHDVPSAFAAMQGRGARSPRTAGGTHVPMIVFHGDRDHTVSPKNADALVRDALPAGLQRHAEQGRVPDGHEWTRETFSDADGHARIERWTVHGSGHAWSGGHPAGSYTDPAGPDASAEMVRFFLQAAPAAG